MNEEDVRLFFQTLYNNNTSNHVQFESRILNGFNNGAGLQIVSAAMSENDAQQVANALKKLLPESANVDKVGSQKVPGQFRAIKTASRRTKS
ncbi:substrate of the Dot/Icm secretion system [Legionella gratiana]|uniref:Substrate of the Dot/Icm secretion system n=1 Tax=Legionella gratiana TaxID=45066 RepID=A0A378J237_9GAMM|nr:hypothetical protein [Legionella gratiana]KTD14575.1 substrate of the Dot/Icm secretion system [Legionella gratiana]STX41813.1 substrate of the Dot/Icm secretion system [Legionella gratiana]